MNFTNMQQQNHTEIRHNFCLIDIMGLTHWATWK